MSVLKAHPPADVPKLFGKTAHFFFRVVKIQAGACCCRKPKICTKRLCAVMTGADFYAFSGHKVCGPMGIGVLYGKKELLEEMPPFLRGGEMIEYVTREGATWAELPHKFEAGTVNASGAVGLASALEYVQQIGFDEIVRHDNSLTSLLMEEMSRIPHVSVVGSENPEKHCGIVTFTIDGVHPHDIASVLDSEKIASKLRDISKEKLP